MIYIECPQIYKGNQKSLFLAGGITGCEDWQSQLVRKLEDENLVLLNPRRKGKFDTSDRTLERKQIAWEFSHLEKASAVSFWFTKETLCPITLYELGKQSAGNKPLFIGVHPNYQRKRDIEIQTKLIRPEIEIVYDLDHLAQQIRRWNRK